MLIPRFHSAYDDDEFISINPALHANVDTPRQLATVMTQSAAPVMTSSQPGRHP